jgi:hypothetical protein
MKHFFFDDLHRQLRKARLTKPGQLFMEFMEENGMESESPFTKADVRHAQHAFPFVKKCVTAIDEIISGIEPQFKKLFHTRASFTKSCFSPTGGWVYAYTRNFHRPGFRQIYISIFIQPSDGELAYGISTKVTRNDMKRLSRRLNWAEDDGELYTWHPISGAADSRHMIPKLLTDLKKLHTGLK